MSFFLFVVRKHDISCGLLVNSDFILNVVIINYVMLCDTLIAFFDFRFIVLVINHFTLYNNLIKYDIYLIGVFTILFKPI